MCVEIEGKAGLALGAKVNLLPTTSWDDPLVMWGFVIFQDDYHRVTPGKHMYICTSIQLPELFYMYGLVKRDSTAIPEFAVVSDQFFVVCVQVIL